MKNKFIIYFFLIGLTILWGECPSIIFRLSDKIELSKPILKDVSIKMKDGWYPTYSTEKGLGIVLSWWNKAQKKYEEIIFENSTESKKISFLRINPDEIENFNSNIIGSGKYPLKNTRFGDAYILYNKPEKIGIYLKRYKLYITAKEMILFKNIIEINHIEENTDKSIIDGDIMYLLIAFLLFLGWILVILKEIGDTLKKRKKQLPKRKT